MDGDARSGRRLHPGRGAEVIAVGQDDARHALAPELLENVLRHLRRIDRDIARSMADEVAVEIVSVALGKPRPGEDAGQDLAHGERVSWPPEEWKMSDELKVPKRRVQVEVLLAGGGARQVTVFLAGVASSHPGPKRRSRPLNRTAGAFLPPIDADSDELMFLNRRSVAGAPVLRAGGSGEEVTGGVVHEGEIGANVGTDL